MKYREIPPPAELSDLVRYFWTIECDDIPTTPSKYRLFAESSPGLVFFYHFNCGVISGLTETYREFAMGGRLGMVGAYLYPYALPLLFRETSEKLANNTFDIEEFLGKEGRLLTEQVVNAPSNDHRIALIGEYLLKKMKTGSWLRNDLRAGVQEIVHHKGVVSIDSLVRDMGISCRHFDRKFLETVGIPPKVFTRLVRFQSTLQLPFKVNVKNLTELALSSGYYDQSHFIRDFKAFSGLSPKEYFKMERHNIADNFVRMPARTSY